MSQQDFKIRTTTFAKLLTWPNELNIKSTQGTVNVIKTHKI